MSNSVKGLEQFDSVLQSIASSLSGQRLESLLVDAAMPILDDARALVSKRTGELADQLQVTSSSSKHSAVVAVEVRDSAPGGEFHRAIFEEFGTRSQAANPFMRTAFELNKKAVPTKVSQGISRLIKESK